MLRAGLCGTDLHLEQWDDWAASTVRPPLVIGHEFYGEVVEIAPDVTAVKVGQRASGEGHVVCSECRNCRAGPIGVMATAIAKHVGHATSW